MERKTETAKALLEISQRLPCLTFVLKAQYDVIGVSSCHHLTARPPLPLSEPQVKDVVQKDIG